MTFLKHNESSEASDVVIADMEPFASVVASDIVRLFLLLFACHPNADLPVRLRDECITLSQQPAGVNEETPVSFLAAVEEHEKVKGSCWDVNEKLWPQDGQCYSIMTRGPCKDNQLFFLDSEDLDYGFCDCRSNLKNGSLLLYSEEADECYLQNTQGPCQEGEWFVLPDDVKSQSSAAPRCEPLPEGCLADGQYVYWSPGDENTDFFYNYDMTIQKECWKLGSPDPCPHGQILQRYITNDVGCQIVGTKGYYLLHSQPSNQLDEEDVDPRAIGMAAYRACGSGSRRAQNGKCRPAF